MKEINYYKQNEILENNYYQIPQELFVNKLYKEKLNSDSKILYAFLLDRLSLSQKNHWIDEDNKVYLIFTREEVQDKLCLSDKTVTKAFKQLTEVNLIEEKRQGLGKPNLIYVGKIQHENQETENRNLRFNFSMLQQEINNKADEIERNYENKVQELEYQYKGKIKELENENKKLNKIIEKFKTNLKMFMKWLCNKFSYPCEDDLIRDFNKETYSNINFEKQLDIDQFEQDYEEEIDFDIY